MQNRKGKRATRNDHTTRRHPKVRWLVLLDQGPLRHAAASECNRAMARLEKVRAEWKRFEHEDKPAFGRWTAATFGALLSRVRETQALVREKEALMREVEMELDFGGARSYRSAYARVRKRRAHPPSETEPPFDAPPPPREEEAEDGGDAGTEGISELERELFEEFARLFLGLNPDRMSRKQYEEMFADFKANVLGEAPPKAARQRNPQPEPPKPAQSRIKELYRLLVRRLHPDTRAESDAEVSALWHEVQEAYETGNVDRLEMLLALTDIQSNTAGEQTSLFQMRSVLAELRSAFLALQRNLCGAKKEPAWNFVRLRDRSALETRLRRDLEVGLAEQEDWLQRIEAQLAKWSAPPKARKKPPKRWEAEFRF